MLILTHNDELKVFSKDMAGLDVEWVQDILDECRIEEIPTVDCPPYDHIFQNAIETVEKLDGKWVHVWRVEQASEEEIRIRKNAYNDQITSSRIYHYREEADPLFFKMQRGEATAEEWQAKIDEIKLRFPKVEVE